MLKTQSDYAFFGGLPYLMKAEILKHLNSFSLLKLSIMSPEWEEHIRSSSSEKKMSIGLELLTSAPGSAEIVISRWPPANVWETDESRHAIGFETRTDMDEESRVEIVDNQKIICCYKNFNEKNILCILRRVLDRFFVKKQDVTIDFGNGFNVEFMEKLDLTQLRCFNLKGLTPEANVDIPKLKGFLEALRAKFATISTFLPGFLSEVTMSGGFEGLGQLLEAYKIESEDSSWIDGESLLHVDSRFGVFKKCVLTSEDFNRYFKYLKAKKYSNCKRVEFHMDEGFELDRTKVLEGLGAQKWTPKTRERKYYISLTDLIDLTDGWDFKTPMGLMTVLFEGNSLKLFAWDNNFPIAKSKSLWRISMDRFNRFDTRSLSSEEKAEFEKTVAPVREKLRLIEEIEKADEYGFSGASGH